MKSTAPRIPDPAVFVTLASGVDARAQASGKPLHASRSPSRSRRTPSRSPAACTWRSAGRATRAAHADPADGRDRRAAVRRERREPRAGQSGGDRRATFGFPSQSLQRHSGGRVLGAAVRERLHEVRARRRAHRLAAHGPVGRTELEALAGQHLRRPGEDHFDPASSTPITLVADKVIPPIAVPADTDNVKRIKIQSQILTKWWGQPIYLGATVLLPKDYDKHPDVKYPVVYDRGPFLAARAGRSVGGRGGAFGQAAARHGATAPRMIYRHAAASVAVLRRLVRRELGEQRPVRRRDHAGADPRGRDAVPRDRRSRGRGCSPAARPAAGSRSRIRCSIRTSTAASGRSAPTAVDFRYHQIVNIYADSNAYWFDRGWMKVERPDAASARRQHHRR